MACEQRKYVGKVVTLEYFIGCGDTKPEELEWKAITGFTSKSLAIEWETTDATDDSTKGNSRETLATWQTFNISGDGNLLADDSESATNLKNLYKHYVSPQESETGGQPSVWMRMTFPDLTFTSYMLVTNMSREAPTDDVATFTFEAERAPSEFALEVVDTI